eukprot:SAG31_NODE_12782_length_917_cov_1.224939_2_plen_88_part_01
MVANAQHENFSTDTILLNPTEEIWHIVRVHSQVRSIALPMQQLQLCGVQSHDCCCRHNFASMALAHTSVIVVSRHHVAAAIDTMEVEN